MTDLQKQADTTATRLPLNIVVALCYLWIWVSGIVMLVIERRNGTVRFHACQSILTFGALTLILFLLSFLPPVPFGIIYYLMLAIWAILIAVGAYLWILLLLKAFQGKPYALPLIGNAAVRLSDWIETRFMLSQPQADLIENTSEINSAGPKFCIVCGKKLPEKAVFCPECGEKQLHEVLAQIDQLGRTIESAAGAGR